MIIRSITQNAMDKKFSIRQFPSPEHTYIAFLQKNLAVLDISRFTFCKVDYCMMLCLRFPLTFPWITHFNSSHTPSLMVCPKKESLRRTTNSRSCLVVLSAVRILSAVRCSVYHPTVDPQFCRFDYFLIRDQHSAP